MHQETDERSRARASSRCAPEPTRRDGPANALCFFRKAISPGNGLF